MTSARAVHVLRRIHRLGKGDALSPAFGVGADDPHQQDVSFGLNPERGLKRAHQLHPNAAQLHLLDLHAAGALPSDGGGPVGANGGAS